MRSELTVRVSHPDRWNQGESTVVEDLHIPYPRLYLRFRITYLECIDFGLRHLIDGYTPDFLRAGAHAAFHPSVHHRSRCGGILSDFGAGVCAQRAQTPRDLCRSQQVGYPLVIYVHPIGGLYYRPSSRTFWHTEGGCTMVLRCVATSNLMPRHVLIRSVVSLVRCSRAPEGSETHDTGFDNPW
eukprot:1177218-Prorocentrum_minimum.AAC.4